ncbi:MAG TPA: DUF115 domain-containing protein, partial [Spirochaetales bacterium]|nr:DUF115 domain-containing protein [Spirochaetales bacterium]
RAVALLENPAIASAYPNACKLIRAAYDRSRQKDRINAATLKRFGRRWVRNLSANTHIFSSSDGIEAFAGAFSAMPAIVLAAGPSLDQVLPELTALRDRCLLICVDTALRSVLRYGVQPDITVVVDPQYWNARHLDRCSADASFLVTEPAVWPSVLRTNCRRVFTCSSLYPLGRYLDSAMGIHRGVLGAGGSVATSAWDLARLASCAPVYMAGLDLSFPDGKTHARASLFEQRSLNRGTRLHPGASDSFEAFRGGQPYEAVANDGSTVVTDKRLSLYAWWFSAKAARYPATPTYNLSERGLAIPGLPSARLSDVLALPVIRPKLDAVLDAIAMLPKPPDRSESLYAAIRGLVAELLRLADLADEAVSLSSGRGSGGQAALARLSAIDTAMANSPAADVVGFLFGSAEDVLGSRAKNLDDA